MGNLYFMKAQCSLLCSQQPATDLQSRINQLKHLYTTYSRFILILATQSTPRSLSSVSGKSFHVFLFPRTSYMFRPLNPSSCNLPYKLCRQQISVGYTAARSYSIWLQTVEWRMNWKWSGRKRPTLSRYRPNIHLEEPRKSLVRHYPTHLPGGAKKKHENVKIAGVAANTRSNTRWVNCEGHHCASFFTSKYSLLSTYF
jgi:hypothetical protein